MPSCPCHVANPGKERPAPVVLTSTPHLRATRIACSLDRHDRQPARRLMEFLEDFPKQRAVFSSFFGRSMTLPRCFHTAPIMCHGGGKRNDTFSPHRSSGSHYCNAGHDYGQISNRQWQARVSMRSHSGRSIRYASMERGNRGRDWMSAEKEKDMNPGRQILPFSTNKTDRRTKLIHPLFPRAKICNFDTAINLAP